MCTNDGETNDDPDSLVLAVYVDLHGEPRGMYVPAEEWDRAVEPGVGFGSIILDYSESDNGRSLAGAPSLGPETGEITVVADPDTRVPMPWVDADHERAACHVHRGGEPSPLCPRTTLSTLLDRIREEGYSPAVGTDYEFVLCEDTDGERLGSQGGGSLREATENVGQPYHARPLTSHASYLDSLKETLAQMDIPIEGIHKESAPGAYEGILAHSDPLDQADRIMIFRSAARGVGSAYGLSPTFIPRPADDAEGNSQHYHCSLWRDGSNTFAGETAEDGLSSLARQFIGGILAHADGLTALCAPTVNSYKRLQPDLWAPVAANWGLDNKTCLVRVPPERGERTRVEVRLPDSFANPFLALTGVFAAGLDGIERELDPGAPTTENVFEQEPDERIPASLGEALDALTADSCLVDALGEPLVDQYVRLKRDEIERFRSTVTNWEVKEYADRL